MSDDEWISYIPRKWKEGIEAYSECVRTATKGPVNDCRAMGGHK